MNSTKQRLIGGALIIAMCFIGGRIDRDIEKNQVPADAHKTASKCRTLPMSTALVSQVMRLSENQLYWETVPLERMKDGDVLVWKDNQLTRNGPRWYALPHGLSERITIGKTDKSELDFTITGSDGSYVRSFDDLGVESISIKVKGRGSVTMFYFPKEKLTSPGTGITSYSGIVEIHK